MELVGCNLGDIIERKRPLSQGKEFVWGRLISPYDGCHWLNVVAFISGPYAFITADLKHIERYQEYVVKPELELCPIEDPVDAEDCPRELKVGCVPLDYLEDVLDDMEIHPIADLDKNLPNALVGQVIRMGEALGFDLSGIFKCKCCGADFWDERDRNPDDGESICHYLEGDFKGNGGIGIDVGEPICQECYDNHRCFYCGEENEPHMNNVDDDGHCLSCAPERFCECCKESITAKLDWWDCTHADMDAWQENMCMECFIDHAKGEMHMAFYAEVEAATGTLAFADKEDCA